METSILFPLQESLRDSVAMIHAVYRRSKLFTRQRDAKRDHPKKSAVKLK